MVIDRASRRRVLRLAGYVWASPTTAFGLMAVALTMVSRGRVQVRRGALEIHGGFATWYLRTMARASGMTLGHVILGLDAECLDWLRDHEQAHVRQVEMWGPAFLPAYVAASLLAWAQGRHYYFDNWFEVDARRRCHEPDPRRRREGGSI